MLTAGLSLAVAPAFAGINSHAAKKSPDAKLITALTEFDRFQRQINATWANGPDRIEGDDERDAHNRVLERRQAPLVALVQQMPARTADGVLAKLRSGWLAQPEFILEGPGCPGERLAASAACDAVAMAPGYGLASPMAMARPLPPHPDAELLALCGRLAAMQAEWQRLWTLTPDEGDADTPADRAWRDYSDDVWPLIHSRSFSAPVGTDDLPARLLTLTATTPEGLQAKAAAILAMDEAGTYLGDIRDDAYGLMQSLLRDAAGAAHRPLGEDADTTSQLPGTGY